MDNPAREGGTYDLSGRHNFYLCHQDPVARRTRGVEHRQALYARRIVHPDLDRVCTRRGVGVKLALAIPDELAIIVRQLRQLSAAYDHVLVCGGIGPTPDDLTRPAVAEAFGRKLEMNEEALRLYAAKWQRELNPGQREMCRLPAGCELIWGRHTVAPGFRVENVYVFPGVPDVLQDMWQAVADRFVGPAVYEHRFRTRAGESRWAHVMARCVTQHPQLSIGSYPRLEGGWYAEVVVRGHDPDAVARVAAELEQDIKDCSDRP